MSKRDKITLAIFVFITITAGFFGYLLDHGIYVAPAQFEAMFVSAAHTQEDIERTCQVLQSYFAQD